MNDGFQRLRELIGDHNAFRMMNMWGGTRLYIPTSEKCTNNHPIALAIGIDALLKLSHEFGSDRIEIPLGISVIKDMRNKEIIALFGSNNASELALRYGMTERNIRNILKKRQPVVDTNQLSLF